MAKRSIRKVFNEFCESTSLHGYNYWYNSDSVILKVVWAVVILVATCLGIVFLVNQTKEYIDARILTTIETSSAPLNVSMGNHCNSYYRHYLIYAVNVGTHNKTKKSKNHVNQAYLVVLKGRKIG